MNYHNKNLLTVDEFKNLIVCHVGAISCWFEYKNLNKTHQNLSEIKSLMHFK